MSQDFHLKGSSLDWAGWERAIFDAVKSSGIELYVAPDILKEGEGKVRIGMTPVGGVRGVTLRMNFPAKSAELTLRSFANVPDYQLATLIAREALVRGGGVLSLDGAPIGSPDSLTPEWARETAREAMKRSVRMQTSIVVRTQSLIGRSTNLGPDERVWLPRDFYPISFTMAEFPSADSEEEMARFEEKLVAQVARYETSYRANVLQIAGNDPAKPITLSNLGPLPTIFGLNLDMVSFGGHGEELRPVPIQVAREILRDHLVELDGQIAWFDGVDLANHPDLCARLAAQAELANSPEMPPSPHDIQEVVWLVIKAHLEGNRAAVAEALQKKARLTPVALKVSEAVGPFLTGIAESAMPQTSEEMAAFARQRNLDPFVCEHIAAVLIQRRPEIAEIVQKKQAAGGKKGCGSTAAVFLLLLVGGTIGTSLLLAGMAGR